MRLFLCYEEGFHKCILYTRIFDSTSVQSLSEQEDFYVNFIVQTLQNQCLDFGGLFRLLQERWHHLRHLSQITLLLVVTSKAFPLTFLFFMEIFLCCIPSSLIKIFLYAMNIINIFITNSIWYCIKTKQVINWQNCWTINSSNNIKPVCEKLQYDPILFQRVKLWEGFGLTDNTSLLSCLRQSDNRSFCSSRSSFLFHSWRHFNVS